LDYYAKNRTDLFLSPGDLGRNMRSVLPRALADRFFECFRNASESLEPQLLEYTLSRNGQERHYEARIVSAGAGRILSIVREITDRKLAEQAMGKSSERILMLAGKLINAPEEERASIANELQDAAANLTTLSR